MKHLLLIASLILVGSASAQTLQTDNAVIQMPSDASTMNGVNPMVKTTACGPDTNGYALAKATGLQALNVNNATSAGAVSQYFDAPQSMTVSGMSFYAWKADVTNGTTMTVNVQMYAAGADSMPTGTPLATTTVSIDTTFSPGTLDALRKHATFTSPVTVSVPYVMVLSNPSATPMSVVFNSWNAADGVQEWLSSAQLGPTWTRSYNLNIGGTLFDADCLFEPHTSYVLTASFLVDDPCFATGLTLNFTNGSSAVVGNRMYNVAAFQNVTDLSYNWNYGDGSLSENAIDATHTYAAAGTYTVTLTDTIYGWTTNCITDTMVDLGGAPTAGFSSVETGLSSTFTNTSVSGSGTTYAWDFGDGNTSTMMDPTHTYATAGTYTVCLTVTDACGTDVSCSAITVTCAVPTPAFTQTSAGTTASFTNTSTAGTGAMYLWDLGDGNTSTQMSPTHTYAADGNYTVCLVVSDNCGADSTCQVVVITSCVNPTAGFTSSETTIGTFDFTSTSTTTGTTTYAWDFGDGNTDATMNPSHTYAAGGTYTVTLTVTDSCGTNTFTGTVSTTVGVNELDLVDLSVYPNPSNGVFAIKSSLEMRELRVTDLSGKLIVKEELAGAEGVIDATQFANGTYFLAIQFANDHVQTVRIEVAK